MFFRYKCISDSGEKVEGIIEASDRSSAVIELKKIFSLVLELKEEKVIRRARRISKKDLITFTDVLSISINAGLPIVKALELAGANVQNKTFREVSNLIISAVRSGKLLSEALSMHPDVFDTLYVSVVRAGESSGELSQAFDSLSKYLEKSFNIASKIKSAMTYPIIILAVAVGVVMFFLTSIVPKFSEIYSYYATELPEITQITISVGNFMKANALYVLFVLGVGGFLFSYLYRNFEEFRNLLQRLLIGVIPVLGNFLLKSEIERFSRVMSVMLVNKVMILEALETSLGVMRIVFLKRAIGFAISEVEKGKLLSEVLADYHFFPPFLIHMIKVGEETGELDKTLKKLADFYSFELERQSEVLISSLSPVLIVIVGLIVAFLVVSIFMPMFSLQQLLLR
ncbi:MAG: type II secretion system F family protein [Brevinematia bacterium]